MWSPNDKVWNPKWENVESNFWHNLYTYSCTCKMMAKLVSYNGVFHFQFCPFISSDFGHVTKPKRKVSKLLEHPS